MGLLNSVVGGIAGGVAGVGAGLTTIAKQWDDRELEAAKQQAEIEKEKRVEEARMKSQSSEQDFRTGLADKEMNFKRSEGLLSRSSDMARENAGNASALERTQMQIDADSTYKSSQAEHTQAETEKTQIEIERAKQLRDLRQQIIEEKDAGKKKDLQQQWNTISGKEGAKSKFHNLGPVLGDDGMTPTGEYNILDSETGEITVSSPNSQPSNIQGKSAMIKAEEIKQSYLNGELSKEDAKKQIQALGIK